MIVLEVLGGGLVVTFGLALLYDRRQRGRGSRASGPDTDVLNSELDVVTSRAKPTPWPR